MADIQTQLPIKITNGTDTVSITTVGANRALLTDLASIYAEDATHASGDKGNFILGVRNDAGGSLAGTDLDYAPFQMDSSGSVRVTVTGTTDVSGTVAVSSVGGTSQVAGTVAVSGVSGTVTVAGTVTSNVAYDYAEDSTHASGDIGSFILAVRNDADSSLVSADGDYAPLQVDANGALKISGSITTTNETAFDEDSAHVSGDKGGFILAVRNDVEGALVDTDGDYAPLQVDASGRLRVVSDTELTTNFDYAEDAAHSSGDQGAFILAVRHDADSSLVGADGDYAPVQVDSLGRIKTTILNTVSVVAGENSDGLVHFYDTAANISNAATGTITYTVTTGKTLYLKSIIASSSGAPCKVVVDYGTGPTNIAVAFYASSSPFIQINFPQPVAIAAEEEVNVKITNNAGTTQDVYATIMGVEV